MLTLKNINLYPFLTQRQLQESVPELFIHILIKAFYLLELMTNINIHSV